MLDALGAASGRLRAALGESPGSLQAFAVPLDEATTSSLDALKAFSLGSTHTNAAAIAYYERAIELDPDFAIAYARLGAMHRTIGQPAQASAHITTAYKLREHTGERDKLYIASVYQAYVTGELEKAIQTYQGWTRSYPRDWLPYLNLGVVYASIGQYDKAAEVTRESARLYPENANAYVNLAGFYLALNRLDEAQQVTDDALAHKLDEDTLHTSLYGLSFLNGDAAGMTQQRGSTARPRSSTRSST